jgi:hypothetical protein
LATRLEGSAKNTKKGPEVTSPGDLMSLCSWPRRQGGKGEKFELDATEATRVQALRARAAREHARAAPLSRCDDAVKGRSKAAAVQ